MDLLPEPTRNPEPQAQSLNPDSQQSEITAHSSKPVTGQHFQYRPPTVRIPGIILIQGGGHGTKPYWQAYIIKDPLVSQTL